MQLDGKSHENLEDNGKERNESPILRQMCQTNNLALYLWLGETRAADGRTPKNSHFNQIFRETHANTGPPKKWKGNNIQQKILPNQNHEKEKGKEKDRGPRKNQSPVNKKKTSTVAPVSNSKK